MEFRTHPPSHPPPPHPQMVQHLFPRQEIYLELPKPDDWYRYTVDYNIIVGRLNIFNLHLSVNL